MKILFVRHAIAMDPVEFGGDDLDRPLTEEGQRKARRTFKALAAFYAAPELIVSSDAKRARQTADLLAEVFPTAKRTHTPEFNPGATYRELMRWLRAQPHEMVRVALVGHEPDISRMIAGVIAGESLNIEVKKGACLEVDCNRIGRGELTLLFPPWATKEK